MIIEDINRGRCRYCTDIRMKDKMATKSMVATDMRLSVNVCAEEKKGRAIYGWLIC
jgi:hypothetical protein